ncbi:hypothetical protein BDV12DRAFT_173618 [Aspergillus spectabilis]
MPLRAHQPTLPNRQASTPESRRGGTHDHPSPLDLALLHVPPVADGYNSFVRVLRTRTIIDPGLLELTICRVAILNQAVYEWNVHAPLALKESVSPEALEECISLPAKAGRNETDVGDSWRA